MKERKIWAVNVRAMKRMKEINMLGKGVQQRLFVPWVVCLWEPHAERTGQKIFACKRASCLSRAEAYHEECAEWKPGKTWLLRFFEDSAACSKNCRQCKTASRHLASFGTLFTPHNTCCLRQEAIWHCAGWMADYGPGPERLPVLSGILPKLQGDAL